MGRENVISQYINFFEVGNIKSDDKDDINVLDFWEGSMKC